MIPVVDLLPPEGQPWDSSNIARSNAEKGRYAPEFDCSRHRPATGHHEPVGMSD